MYVGLDVQIVRIQKFLKVLVLYQSKLRWLLLRNAIDLIVCYNTTILGSASRLWAIHFLRNCTVPSKYEVLFNVFKELCIHVVRTLLCLVWIWYMSFILILRCHFIGNGALNSEVNLTNMVQWNITWIDQWPLLLIWINFHPSTDK